MALKNLNAQRETYKEFYGRNVDQMPKLIAEGRTPMSVAGLMQRRLNVRNDPAMRSDYMDNYFDTGDAIAYSPNGEVKIVYDSQILRDMTSQSPRDGGALVLTDDVYKALDGVVFKKGKLGKVETQLSREAVKAHPVWKALSRDDQELLNDYVDYIFTEGKQKHGYDEAMGVYPDSAGNKPKLRAWYVNRLEDRSYAYGGSSLGYDYGRFVGIAPEALSASGNGSSAIQSYTQADVDAFDKAIKGLDAIVRPELLAPFAQLRSKL